LRVSFEARILEVKDGLRKKKINGRFQSEINNLIAERIKRREEVKLKTYFDQESKLARRKDT